MGNQEISYLFLKKFCRKQTKNIKFVGILTSQSNSSWCDYQLMLQNNFLLSVQLVNFTNNYPSNVHSDRKNAAYS